MTKSLRILMANVIDYAGTFPPARLDLPAAMKNYETYRQGNWSWTLGKFVAPAAHVETVTTTKKWPVTVVAGPDLEKTGAWPVESVEIRVASTADIERAQKLIPASLTTYFEIPVTGDLLPAVSKAGARAKVRTGGDAIPDSPSLARFIVRCAEAGVPFKATAGLHQALRTDQHGFLNVALAAAFALNGAKTQTLVELLDEKSAKAFTFADDSVTWRSHRLTTDQLRRSRQDGFVSFGSCSFDEPVTSLNSLWPA